MDYGYTWYDNFAELIKGDKLTAKLILDELDMNFEDGDNSPQDYKWARHVIYVYPSLKDYTAYELTDGMYYPCNFENGFKDIPNPVDFIDINRFGKELIEDNDRSSVLLLPNGKIVTTDYSW